MLLVHRLSGMQWGSGRAPAEDRFLAVVLCLLGPILCRCYRTLLFVLNITDQLSSVISIRVTSAYALRMLSTTCPADSPMKRPR